MENDLLHEMRRHLEKLCIDSKKQCEKDLAILRELTRPHDGVITYATNSKNEQAMAYRLYDWIMYAKQLEGEIKMCKCTPSIRTMFCGKIDCVPRTKFTMKEIKVGDKIHLEQDGNMVWAHLEGDYGPHVMSGFGEKIPEALRQLADEIECHAED